MVISDKGSGSGYAKIKKDIPFPDSTTNWEWEWWNPAADWTKANKGLGVKGNSLYFTNKDKIIPSSFIILFIFQYFHLTQLKNGILKEPKKNYLQVFAA